jgi:hypothetical protein
MSEAPWQAAKLLPTALVGFDQQSRSALICAALRNINPAVHCAGAPNLSFVMGFFGFAH